jgi:seryl-tRNA synthetase
MARRTKAEIEAEWDAIEERLRQEEEEVELLEKARKFLPQIDRLAALEEDNRRLTADNERLKREKKDAEDRYKKLADEWNWVTARHKIPASSVDSSQARSAKGELVRTIAEKLTTWLTEGK